MQTHIPFVRQSFWGGLVLLLSGTALACSASTDEESDRSEGSVTASSAEGTLDPAAANLGGFVNEVELSAGVRGTKFEPTRGQPFWEIGKACKSDRQKCESVDYTPDTNIVGKITFGHNDVTLFKKTSFVQWDDVSIQKGDSLEYRWAFLSYGAGPENSVAMAWFIDDAGKLVDIVVLSTENLLDEKSVNQTSWTDSSWKAKENFHGSVRFSLSAGFYYGEDPESPFPILWPTGTLLLDKTVSVKSAESGASQEAAPANDCTIETSLQTVQTVCSGKW